MGVDGEGPPPNGAAKVAPVAESPNGPAKGLLVGNGFTVVGLDGASGAPPIGAGDGAIGLGLEVCAAPAVFANDGAANGGFMMGVGC